jgi:allantoicase
VSPIFPEDVFVPLDLAHVYSGGRVVAVSDQHYGVGANLLLPGRGAYSHRISFIGFMLPYPILIGKDMGDGWETKRSRTPGHNDWVIIKLWVERPRYPWIKV